MRDDAGELLLTDAAKQKAWLQHYERPLNVEFECDPQHLSVIPLVEGPCIPITSEMVMNALSKMKSGKSLVNFGKKDGG